MASNEYDTVAEVHELKAGNLQRKNELDEGGRRVCGCCLDCLLTVLNIIIDYNTQATSRSWKMYYTVLSGPCLKFYKDRRDTVVYIDR